MAEYVYRAMWSLLTNVLVTVVVTFVTTAKPEKELEGLVYGMTAIPSQEKFPVFQRPVTWAIAVGVGFVLLNVLFW
jgi:SSS family solute:Na+ symporter